MKAQKILTNYIPNILKVTLSKKAPYLYERLRLKPSFAALNITDRCCFRCIMCDQWKNKSVDELSTDQWVDILSQLKKLGIRDVTFSGGEPFLRRDIIDIISYAENIGLVTGIITNGYLLDEDILKRCIQAGVKTFAISIDATEDRFDNIRGIKGAYQKVIGSCRLLSQYQKEGIDIYLYFTLMKATLDTYKDIIELAKNLDFKFAVNLFDYTPYFFKDLKKEKDNFWINNNGDFHRLKELQKDLIGRKENKPSYVYHTYSEIKYFGDYFRDPIQRNIPCIVSQQRIGMDSQGNVYGGCWSMGSFGNLKEKSLSEIINSAGYKSAHKKMFFKDCPGCSCGYPKNLRYYFPSLVREALFRISPFMRNSIWR